MTDPSLKLHYGLIRLLKSLIVMWEGYLKEVNAEQPNT